MRQPRLLIADDDPAMRQLLRRTVEADSEIVGEARDGQEAVTAAERLRPDLVLLDVSMPIMTGFEAAREILLHAPGLLIVFVSQHAETVYAEEAFSVGAQGYVLKRALFSELREAMSEVLAGRPYRSPLLS
ncbi:MAG: response regulator transcription factor [Bryobacteraceae bacterium]